MKSRSNTPLNKYINSLIFQDKKGPEDTKTQNMKIHKNKHNPRKQFNQTINYISIPSLFSKNKQKNNKNNKLLGKKDLPNQNNRGHPTQGWYVEVEP